MKKLKNIGKCLTSFGAWAIITVICLAAIFLGIGNPGFCSATIVSTFLLLPMRRWTTELSVLILKLSASNMDGVRAALEPWATITDLANDKKKSDNKAFYTAIKVAVGALYGFVALVCWVFQGVSVNFVYGFIHNIVTVASNLGSDGWERASVLIWLILAILTTAVIAWFISLFIRGEWENDAHLGPDPDIRAKKLKKRQLRDIITAVVAFIIQRVTTYICLEYTLGMIGSNLLFWTIVLVIPILFSVFILPKITPALSKWFH